VVKLPKYYGIKKGYPRIEKIFGRASAYIQLMRVFTLIAPITAGLFGVLTQLVHDNMLFPFIPKLPKLVLAILAIMFAQAFGQVVNQIEDIEIDRINKPYRPLVTGVVSVEHAKIFSLALQTLSLVCSALVNLYFFLFVAIILFFAFSYNSRPFRIKERSAWGSLLWMALSRGLLPFPAFWSVFGKTTVLLPWILGMICSFWVFAFQGTKDFADIEGDRQFNIPTLPVVYGEQKSINMMIYLGLFASVLPLLFVACNILSLSYLTFLLLFMFVFIIVRNFKSELRSLEKQFQK